MGTSPSESSDKGLRDPNPAAPDDLSQAELFALPISRTYGGSHRYRRRRPRNSDRPQLRGRAADEAAHYYLGHVFADGEWHELEGLRILASATGIPRRAFDAALAGFALETCRRGAHEEQYVRLMRRDGEFVVLARDFEHLIELLGLEP